MFQSVQRIAEVREAGLRPALSRLKNKQRRYRYSLLASTRLRPVRDILSVNLRESEEQVQPWELAKGDEHKFRPIGRGRETLGQQIAKTITQDTSIVTTVEMEHTKCVKLETFLGNTAYFAYNKKEGAKEAKKYTNGPGKMSL